MAYTEVLTSHGLTAEQWDNDLFKEYITELWWKNLMGTSTDAIIQVKDDLTKKPGDALTIGVRGQMQGGKVTGNNKAAGNEGKVDFFSQRITIDNVRYVIKIENVPMSQKRVGFDVLSQAKDALTEKSRIGMEDDITTAMVDTTARVRGRYLYGATDSNWNATHATALTNIDNTSDQLTTSMLGIAKRKALLGVNATALVRPMKVKNGKNMEKWYCFVGHTYSLRDMINNDAAWKNAQLNIPPQSNGESPLFTGSSFKGSWDGTLIYEYERIPLVASTIQVSHNLFLGAQAAAVVWGQRSKFGEEDSDLGHDMTYETHEIRGISKIYFDRATQEDHGIVHVFAAAVAD